MIEQEITPSPVATGEGWGGSRITSQQIAE